MYKVSIPVLKLALKNQEHYKIELELNIYATYDPSSTIYKKELARVKKSIKELKFILGE